MKPDITLPPLLIRLVYRSDSRDATSFADTVREAFCGTNGFRAGYVNTAYGLPVTVQQMELAHLKHMHDNMGAAMHTLAVALVDDSWSEDDFICLYNLANNISQSQGRHGLVTACLGQTIPKNIDDLDQYQDNLWLLKLDEALTENNPNSFKAIDRYIWGEHAERSTWLALYALGRARLLLHQGIYGSSAGGKIQFFISHAKKDGLPLARALEHLVSRKDFMKTWYDLKNLYDPAGSKDWRKQITSGVEHSTVIVLRTKEYDKRPWCRHEFIRARECGLPMVNVELRIDLERGCDSLGHHAAPTLWITDGNLFRVVFVAMRESIRRLLLERFHLAYCVLNGSSLPSTIAILSYTPTLAQTAHAMTSNPSRNIILYPDPPLGGIQRDAILKLADQGGFTLKTPRELILDTYAYKGGST